MMQAVHLEFLVEEPSMEAFLNEFLPRIVRRDVTFAIHTHQGKPDLLRKLEPRLRAYARWLPADHRVVVLIDRDDDDCITLKARMEQVAASAGLLSRTSSGNLPWKVVNRVVVEELEAWFFGEWEAACRAYPRLPSDVPNKAAYRDCDAILGGTWEAVERVLKRNGYFSGGLRKVEFAQTMGRELDHTLCRSPSFIVFRDALYEAIA